MRLFGFLLVMAMSGTALADVGPGNAEAGLEFARGHCAKCHYVERSWDGQSPWGAPAFQDIAGDARWTPIALRVFLRTPHQGLDMPDFILTDDEIDDVTAYLRWLSAD